MKNQRGSVILLVGLLLVVFCGVAALAVDISIITLTKSELQRVADAAALAGCRKLGLIYESMTPIEQKNYECYPYDIIAISQATAYANTAGTKHIEVSEEDIQVGIWNKKTNTFTPELTKPNAVRVMARRDNISNGPITTTFARVLGKNYSDVRADAVASLTPQSTIPPGQLNIPVGISNAWFENKEVFCNQPIKFYPTNTPEGCAGWNTYTENPANAAKLRSILRQLKAGTYDVPGADTADSFEFIGGAIGANFDDMKALFDYMKIRDDDDDPNTWTTSVVVYDWPDCSNPHGKIKIDGFATVVITDVLEAPEKTIMAKVVCEKIKPGKGSSQGDYGTMGSIPGLVE